MEPRGANFAERYGYVEFETGLQYESVDRRTRVALFNLIFSQYVNRGAYSPVGLKTIWTDYFHRLAPTFQKQSLLNAIRTELIDGQWYDVYRFVEFLAQSRPTTNSMSAVDEFNKLLIYNRAGYRVLDDGTVCPVTDANEVEALNKAMGISTNVTGAHIRKAAHLLASRDNPNFAKSIHESISAAEAAARDLTGATGGTLADALKTIRNQGSMHRALVDGWSKLYGFTSDSGGIRHADVEGSMPATLELAQYFLVTCSAFVNLVTALKTAED